MIRSLTSHLSPSVSEYWGGVFAILAIVAGIALVLGLIGEFSDSERWKSSYWYQVAKVAVILGVLGELIGDAGVFGIAERLQCFQSQEITRHLPPDELASMSTALSHFKGTVANVWVFSGTRQEKIEFAVSLAMALRNAGWKTNGVTTRLKAMPLKSVIVRWRDGSKANAAAEALMNALSEACITVAAGGAFTDNGDFGGTVYVGSPPPGPVPTDIFGPQPLSAADVSILVGEAL